MLFFLWVLAISETSGFECKCAEYDNQWGVVLVIYDMVIIKHYFSSGILALFWPTIMTIDSDFAITIYD